MHKKCWNFYMMELECSINDFELKSGMCTNCLNNLNHNNRIIFSEMGKIFKLQTISDIYFALCVVLFMIYKTASPLNCDFMTR